MEEKTLLLASLVYPIKDKEVTLAIKKHKIGAGCRNGYGGGKEPEDKNIYACAKREFEQETGGANLFIKDLKKVAIIDFHNTKSNGETFICQVHVFFVKKWKGEFKDTDEMQDAKPFDFDNLPSEIMPADEIFLPMLLAGNKLRATFYYGPYQKQLIAPFKIKIVKNLS